MTPTWPTWILLLSREQRNENWLRTEIVRMQTRGKTQILVSADGIRHIPCLLLKARLTPEGIEGLVDPRPWPTRWLYGWHGFRGALTIMLASYALLFPCFILTGTEITWANFIGGVVGATVWWVVTRLVTRWDSGS